MIYHAPTPFIKLSNVLDRAVQTFHGKQGVRRRNPSAVGVVEFLTDKGISCFLPEDRQFNPVNVKNYWEVGYVVRKCCVFCLADG
jgi:hypothetical protein